MEAEVVEREKGGKKEGVRERFEDVKLLALKMERGM